MSPTRAGNRRAGVARDTETSPEGIDCPCPRGMGLDGVQRCADGGNPELLKPGRGGIGRLEARAPDELNEQRCRRVGPGRSGGRAAGRWAGQSS